KATHAWGSRASALARRADIAEARDASFLKNEVAKLPMQQSDRFEEAWKRVVMRQGSMRDIVRITGASDGPPDAEGCILAYGGINHTDLRRSWFSLQID